MVGRIIAVRVGCVDYSGVSLVKWGIGMDWGYNGSIWSIFL